MSILGQCIEGVSSSSNIITGLFIMGLVGSAAHCTGMCGPFVLAQSGKGGDGALSRLKDAALIPYHLGRMTTYVGLGVAFYSFFNLAGLFMPSRALLIAPLLLLAGIIFLASAIPSIAALFPWAARITLGLPYSIVSSLMTRLGAASGFFRRYAMGVLLGFMPCGLVVSAIMAVSAATSVYGAAFAMAAFALGTVPALIGVALGGQMIKAAYPQIFPKLQQAALVCSGLWLFALAGMSIF